MKRSNPSTSSSGTSRQPSTSRQAQGSKKTRFISPEEDPARFAEDVDAQLEDSRRASKTRKGGVKVDGYDSDSSDDGEGVVMSRRKDGKGDGDGEDDDMFAMGEKDEKMEDDGEGKKKKTEYLRLADIEGQEFNDRASKGSDSESESEPEDLDEAERRAKKGMGFEITHFNMRDELEEGRVTEEGDYIRTVDPHAMHDRWLEEMNEREIKRARKAKRKQEKLEAERERREDKEAGNLTKQDAEKEIAGMLRKGETVLEALARLGDKAKKAKEKEKKCVLVSSVFHIHAHDPFSEQVNKTSTHLRKPKLSVSPPSPRPSCPSATSRSTAKPTSNFFVLFVLQVTSSPTGYLQRQSSNTNGTCPRRRMARMWQNRLDHLGRRRCVPGMRRIILVLVGRRSRSGLQVANGEIGMMC